MEEIGKTLRATREQLGLTLDEIARMTRIRKARLEALERGEMDSMPSEAQARGFLRNYAVALGLDPEELLAQYGTSRAAGRKSSRQKATPQARAQGARTARGGRSSSELLITAVVALGVIAVLVWGGGSILESLTAGTDAAATETLAAGRAEAATETSEPTAAQPPNEAALVLPTAPSPTATLVLNVLDRVNLRIVAESDSFVEVIVDDAQAFRGRMQANDEQSFIGDRAISVTTGNAGGLRIFFNDLDQGLMGEIGQVLVRIWTPRGAQTPTPTVTVTPSPSPFLTETATSVQTPSATPGP